MSILSFLRALTASEVIAYHSGRIPVLQAFGLLALIFASVMRADAEPHAGWSLPGGEMGGGHFSAASQITRANVANLEVAWTHRSGDFREGESFIDGLTGEEPLQSSWQATPILIEDHLVFCTPFNRIISVNAETGEERWSYTPDIDLDAFPMPRCRGVTQWINPAVAAGATCHVVVIAPLMDARVIGLDAPSGERCSFGQQSELDLSEGLGPFETGFYMLNTPPAIVGNTLITGGSIADNVTTAMPSGVVRAYDLSEGGVLWAWEPLVGPDGTPPSKEESANGDPAMFRQGTTNAWSFFSVDPELGLVFVPTGNTSADYYGGHREGLDYYSSSVVALRVADGEVAWHFQTVRHDIWDFDVPSQPTLFDIERDGKLVRGLAQTTKQGYVYLLDRATGDPLFPIIETPVPQGAVAGDFTAPTQPIPSKPRSLFDLPGEQESVWGLTPWDKGACADVLASLRYEGPFTPPDVQGSLHMPSAFGGHNWGGPAIDRARGKLIVNTLHVGTVVQMIPRDQCDSGGGQGIHSASEQATESAQTVADIEPVALGPFLAEPSAGTPFCDRRWLGFVSPLGAPCTPPPWGTLAAIDLASGEVDWQVPLGTTRDMAPWPFWYIKGSPNLGGPVVTASGLTFIGATTDHFLRAFDTNTGEELWKGRLPTSGHGLPITYQLRDDSKQFVVIAAGGHASLGTPPGDYLVAFTLPE